MQIYLGAWYILLDAVLVGQILYYDFILGGVYEQFIIDPMVDENDVLVGHVYRPIDIADGHYTGPIRMCMKIGFCFPCLALMLWVLVVLALCANGRA